MTASPDSTIRVWNVDTAACSQVIKVRVWQVSTILLFPKSYRVLQCWLLPSL